MESIIQAKLYLEEDPIQVLRGLNTDNARKVPADAASGFIKTCSEEPVITNAVLTGATTNCARWPSCGLR